MKNIIHGVYHQYSSESRRFLIMVWGALSANYKCYLVLISRKFTIDRGFCRCYMWVEIVALFLIPCQLWASDLNGGVVDSVPIYNANVIKTLKN